jgi:hypothetical protein
MVPFGCHTVVRYTSPFTWMIAVVTFVYFWLVDMQQRGATGKSPAAGSLFPRTAGLAVEITEGH